jgi:hypothetical protein
MRTAENCAAILSLLLLTSVPAFAEEKPSAKPQDPAQSCRPAPKGGEKGESLGESKGVICPPENRDPEIKVPPPDSGANMPVIKPPPSAK